MFGAATEKLADEPATGSPGGWPGRPRAAEIPGFAIADRKVIGTFTYAKLPMVRDLQAAGDLLADSDVVAAIAGDPEAQELLGPTRRSTTTPSRPLACDSPEDDYSVLDADSSQRSAIDAVLAGRSLVIHGPPGTGKSQTIANLIAALVARGRKVLFVAEKRAAIDAVLSRLKGVDLGELVLDIHEGTRDRQRIAARPRRDAWTRRSAPAGPDVAGLHRRLTDRQRRLGRARRRRCTEPHEPWGLTAVPGPVRAARRRRRRRARRSGCAAPERITAELADEIRDELREFAHLGGFALRPGSTPWFGAALRSRGAGPRRRVDLAVRLSTRPAAAAGPRRPASAELGLRPPASYAEAVAGCGCTPPSQQTLPASTGPSTRPTRPGSPTPWAAAAGLGFARAPRRCASRPALAGGQASCRARQLAAALAAAASQLASWRRGCRRRRRPAAAARQASASWR